ncbi:hypothetical protein [Corynebacterium auriscanis]|uniref:ADP ribosyltransferase domain-containing protein n=1 Tax=Corynebacterium auriscanis TaxID=99807 RepID=A0A0A2DG68_9CORY|nr:hypothetical protein [Corynebacterium auriscanis]KGM18175.1 hypothetical protein MA47_09885 [Corynebacterium auriscanis]WJY73270.1 hypothetical protein CAURIC_08285 [Corynebacterium auriscanis]
MFFLFDVGVSWCGVRNWHDEFGVETIEELLDKERFKAKRFKAITAAREVAEEEFRTFGKAGALLKITARKGTPGIWMPTNGDAELVPQQEFLVPPGATMKVVRVEKGEVPLIHVEMIYGRA